VISSQASSFGKNIFPVESLPLMIFSPEERNSLRLIKDFWPSFFLAGQQLPSFSGHHFAPLLDRLVQVPLPRVRSVSGDKGGFFFSLLFFFS